jgi:hypothetical protein
MSQLHDASGRGLDIKPDSISYSSAINCWAKSGLKDDPDAALKLLHTMKQQYLAGDKSLRPNSIVYETVIRTLVQAGPTYRAKELRDETRAAWK